jgi:glutamine synthetase
VSASSTLDQILSQAKAEASVLRRHSAAAVADALERLCAQVENATEDYRRFVPESNAALRTGWSIRKLRRVFREWEAQGHARYRGPEREYRLLVLPQRANPSAAYEAGRNAGKVA